MKKIAFFIFTVLSFNTFSVIKENLTLQVDYHPKQMTWSIDKKNLGTVITQKMIFQGNGKDDYKIKVTPLEYLYKADGTVQTGKMLTSSEKNKRSLLPFIGENAVLKIAKDKKVEYNFKVKTNKAMSGCYFFAYYPKVVNDKKNNSESPNKKEELKTGMSLQLKMLSGGYLHIKGTEFFKVIDNIKIKKGKNSQELTYNFELDGNCILPSMKIKLDIYQGNKSVLSKNKVPYSSDDRSLLPGMVSNMKLNTKLKKGEYKLRILMYSENENFKSFFHIKEEKFKI